MSYLAELVAQNPFGHIDRSAVYDCYATFLSPTFARASNLPTSSPHGDVEVIQYTKADMMPVAYKPGRSPGSPNAFAERHLRVQATTRA
jgi:hypothetical protein